MYGTEADKMLLELITRHDEIISGIVETLSIVNDVCEAQNEEIAKLYTIINSMQEKLES